MAALSGRFCPRSARTVIRPTRMHSADNSLLETPVKNGKTETWDSGPEARPAQDGTARLCFIVALGVTMWTSLSALTHAQVVASPSRDAHPALNPSMNMTELNT